MKSSIGQRISLFIILVFSVWLSFYVILPPTPKPDTAPSTEFSAERAFEHVKQIAQKPHPLGSAANDSARNYILQQLKEFGLDPVVQEGIGVGTSYDLGLVGNTKNIFARMEGDDPDKTILLMAHYDSTPTTIGAADDASGTAAILETIRAIKAQNTPLKNNVWILITDGEERGLLGAEMFTADFKELDQIDLVLNVEARGSSGPSFMFETSSPNGKLITHFAQASKEPVANSLMYTVYKLLPNDTDLSVIKRAGLSGLNFAFTKDFLNYHTLQDTPENLSLASLQHHGSNLLNNTLYFGSRNFDIESETEFVYFNNATGGLMYYPSGWSLPLALVTVFLFIAYLIFLFRTRQLGIGPYLGSILLFLGLTVTSGLITFWGWQMIKTLHPQYQWLIQGEVYNLNWYFWGFTLLNLALFSTTYAWFQKKLSTQQLISGSFTVWIILSLATAWYLPTASYVFSWPVLTALVGWIILGGDISKHSWKTTGILGISLFAVLYMLPPYIHLIQVMLTTEMLAVSMVLLVLILGLSWPLFWQIIRGQERFFNSAIALGALGCLLMASVNSGYDAEHKKQNSINYVQNLDTDEAFWISRDNTVDAWTNQFLGSDYQKGQVPNFNIPRSKELLYTPADSISIAEPKLQLLSNSVSNDIRHLKLEMNAGQGIALHMSWNQPLTKIGIHGKTVFSKEDMQNFLYYFQDLKEPVVIQLSHPASNPSPSLQFTFVVPGLPTQRIKDYKERPDDAMPPPFSVFMSDATILHITMDLEDVLVSQSQ